MLPPPLPLSEDAARAVAEERLRLLSLGYYVSGAIGVIMVSFAIFHCLFFAAFSFMPARTWEQGQNGKSSETQVETATGHHHSDTQDFATMQLVFRFISAIIGLIILSGWILGGLTIYAGRCIARRQNRTFVLIMAGVNCIWIPFGTLLGVLTFMALQNDTIRKLY
jgi:hypothetical protein